MVGPNPLLDASFGKRAALSAAPTLAVALFGKLLNGEFCGASVYSTSTTLLCRHLCPPANDKPPSVPMTKKGFAGVMVPPANRSS